MTTDAEKPIRHILSLSGGKDSTALAIFMRDRIPNVEYAFCDTGEELPETYEYLDRLEVFLGKQITRLNPDRPFKRTTAEVTMRQGNPGAISSAGQVS